MLRIHFLQHWFELSDPGAKEALYDSRAMRLFVGIDLGDETGVWGDSACAGQKETLNAHAPRARDFTQQKASRYRQLTEAAQSANIGTNRKPAPEWGTCFA
jgi:hypothetical protein